MLCLLLGSNSQASTHNWAWIGKEKLIVSVEDRLNSGWANSQFSWLNELFDRSHWLLNNRHPQQEPKQKTDTQRMCRGTPADRRWPALVLCFIGAKHGLMATEQARSQLPASRDRHCTLVWGSLKTPLQLPRSPCHVVLPLSSSVGFKTGLVRLHWTWFEKWPFVR